MELIIKTLQGLEHVLAQEVKDIGGTDIEILNRAVRCRAHKPMLYRLNMSLQSAIRILVPLAEFSLRNPDNIYYKGLDTPWEDWFSLRKTFAIFASGEHPTINNSNFASLRLKDAIADRFRRKFGKRPDIDSRDPHIRIELHFNHNKARFLMDASGESLHIRRYKQVMGEAPLSEVLAAGLVKLSGWDPQTPFLDPMCGSGTIPIEAALFSSRSMPQFHRNNFSCRNWNNYNKQLWQMERTAAMQRRIHSPAPIYASDNHRSMIYATDKNAEKAGVSKDISTRIDDFFDLRKPSNQGTIIINPPYDERMKQDDIEKFYKEISDKLKNDFSGWTACLISANDSALKSFALKPRSSHKVYNGPLPSNFLIFDLYKGSR